MLRPTESPSHFGAARALERGWPWLAILAAALALLTKDALGRWIAMALVLTAGPSLLAPILRQLARWPWLAERETKLGHALPYATLGALALALLGELALGRPPASRDHGIHFFQTRVLVDELIPRGQLIGFSHQLNSGYPFGDSYPVLGYLLTGAANLLSFGWISLRTSYAWGLLLVWVIALVGVWWLAQSVAQELIANEREGARDGGDPKAAHRLLDPRWAGAFAAIAWLIDPGSSREGGWNYLMFHGVWPQLLSTALWITSLPATWAALRKPSPRSLSLAALLLGGSVLAHPFGMLTAAASAAGWPLAIWASGAMRHRLPTGSIRWGLLIHLGAALVCVGWLYVFLASAESMARSPVPWMPLGEIATQLVAGELFQDHRAWVGPLAVFGLAVGIRRGRSMAWLSCGLLCALLVLGSDAAITVLRLDLLVSGFKNLQFPRYAIALKPLLYVFTGLGAATLAARLRSAPSRDHALDGGPRSSSTMAARPQGARLLAALCLAPLLVGVLDDRGRLLPRPVGSAEVLEGTEHADTDQALLAALEAEATKLRERPGAAAEPRLRVAFLRQGMGGGTFPLFAITDADADLVLDGHIPAVNYKRQVRRRAPKTLRMLGVTHVIHDRPLVRSADDRRLAEALEPIGEFGGWTLARLEPAPSSLGFEPQGAIDPAQVEVERDDPEHLLVRLRAGAGAVGLPLAPYRKWEARRRAGERDGELLTIEEATLAGGVPGLRVTFDEPGFIDIRYRTPALERALGWLSLLSAAALLGLLAWGRPLELAARLHAPKVITWSWLLGLATAAVLLAWAVHRQHTQLANTWDKVLSDHSASAALARGRPLSFERDLIARGDWSVSREGPDACEGLLGKDALAGCTETDHAPRVSMAYRRPFLYRCLRVELPAEGSATISLAGIDPSEDLAGFVVREDRSFEGFQLRFAHEAPHSPPARHKRQEFHVRAGDLVRDAEGDVQLELLNASSKIKTVCLSAAAASSSEG
ncbi:hypothetical protein G6O69_11000 [Pseudenhygromyxa sp. WMMC2535]|uniref:DUF6541 family protein n=1 Tax=Pseudenhygromyxa sp. WMMC2535 TaxID=2712867 RepID=UPI001552D742|nr:DUF6541 family protein [Pseudenhygromyxa sp. WMMC2535]NVB38358.1 hypothetical protein [Pseudenhygromyxa sp. WMMC2535]